MHNPTSKNFFYILVLSNVKFLILNQIKSAKNAGRCASRAYEYLIWLFCKVLRGIAAQSGMCLCRIEFYPVGMFLGATTHLAGNRLSCTVMWQCISSEIMHCGCRTKNAVRIWITSSVHCHQIISQWHFQHNSSNIQ